MLTNLELAAFCEGVYKAGWVYWYGTYGNACTLSKYESKAKQYPYPKYSHYIESRKAGYMADIAAGKTCADCVGMIKAFFWSSNILGGKPVYKANNCPDVSANGMIALCRETGKIGTMPDIPGLVVWKEGHIGVHVGGGIVVEMNGFKNDCLRRKVTANTWTKWGRLPETMLLYADCDDLTEPEKKWALGERVLKNGMKGDDVCELQMQLLAIGMALPRYGADGDFGSETEAAVLTLQAQFDLPETGIVDAATLKMLGEILDYPHEIPINGEGEPDEPPVRRFVLLIEGDEADLRAIQVQYGGKLAEYESIVSE